MASPRIEKCTCSHDYQDEKYGKNNRVWNPCAKEDNFRCSICGKTQFLSKQKVSVK